MIIILIVSLYIFCFTHFFPLMFLFQKSEKNNSKFMTKEKIDFFCFEEWEWENDSNGKRCVLKVEQNDMKWNRNILCRNNKNIEQEMVFLLFARPYNCFLYSHKLKVLNFGLCWLNRWFSPSIWFQEVNRRLNASIWFDWPMIWQPIRHSQDVFKVYSIVLEYYQLSVFSTFGKFYSPKSKWCTKSWN